MIQARAWIKAARPLAQANIIPPLLWGQAIAFAQTGAFSVQWLLWALLFGVLDQLLIVFTNDVSDRATDAQNTSPTPFSGGSRVLVEGELSVRALSGAALVSFAALAALGAYLALIRERPLLLPLIAAGVLLVWAYDLPPLRLSYRGGGEVIQGLGIGVILPLSGYYLQVGTLLAFPLQVLIPAFILGFAGHITTALPDVESDRRAAKHTYPVRHGVKRARRDSVLLVAATAPMALLIPGLGPTTVAALGAGTVLLPIVNLLAGTRPDALQRRGQIAFVLLNGLTISLQWLTPTVVFF